jgi:hypothetical protein
MNVVGLKRAERQLNAIERAGLKKARRCCYDSLSS